MKINLGSYLYYSLFWILADRCLNFDISSTIKTTHGMRDRKEKIIPITPADDGIIIKIPEISPHTPTDFLNSVLLIIEKAKSNRHIVLET